MKQILCNNIAKDIIENNQGEIYPIIFDYNRLHGVSLMNPSIYNDNGIIKACVRCVNYNLHHSSIYPHWNGPLQYIHPENFVKLVTENYLVSFNDNFDVIKSHHIEMLNMHKPIWDFHGLEDGRLFRWNDKLYICGVRRDTTPNGQGRMEISEIIENDDRVFEISRVRIPSPNNDSTYCEKNWMPIINKPNKFIIWSNPTNIVTWNSKFNIIQEDQKQEYLDIQNDVRGGSQVIKYKKYYIAIGHSVDLWKPISGEKDANYYSYIIIWDSDFNLLKISNPFKFMDFQIEFCCGLCKNINNKEFLISFSIEDNTPYILKVNADWLLKKVFNNEL